MEQLSAYHSQSRLGFHYLSDTVHYRAQDLETWLPELMGMGASWLTLLAPVERAIPEHFIRGLLQNDIQVILHFQLKPHGMLSTHSLQTLFKSYARWGVTRVALFDRPNNRTNWSPSAWAQENLVERFLDQFIPLAELAIQSGLDPIFPPLEPGGDYWDLSFLQAAFRGLLRRGRTRLLDRLGLGAYAWIGDRPLDWGLGGPDLWPGALPYHTAPNCQDHKGFRIFDWYLDIIRREIGRTVPTFLLRAGALPDDSLSPQGQLDFNRHSEMNVAAAQLMLGDLSEARKSEAIPDEVKACCFWLLASDGQERSNRQAWISSEGNRLPVVQAFYQMAAQRFIVRPDEVVKKENAPQEKIDAKKVFLSSQVTFNSKQVDPEIAEAKKPENAEKPLSHYVLLPLYAWGASEWDLDTIQPIMKETHPTVGFSLTEACLASRVTVIGGEGAISSGAVDLLRKNGCIVERIQQDGTLVAP